MESERAMLAHRASHDTLTALPNRAAFDEQLALRIAALATVCGLLASVAPARRASRLDPAQAIRL